MPYDARAIANYFLDMASYEGQTLDPMKLQKLVYFAHGWNLAIRNQPLINDRVEAWEYGPVIPSLYREFKKYGAGAITEPATSPIPPGTWFGTGRSPHKYSIHDCTDRSLNPFTEQLLDTVWNSYKNLSAVQLSNLTHEPGAAWDVARSQAHGVRGVVISDDLIRRDFTNLSRQNDAARR